MRAVILAGGKGTRLEPYTTILPKPLMPIGDMPILEILLRQMKRGGIDHAVLTVGHLASSCEPILGMDQNGGWILPTVLNRLHLARLARLPWLKVWIKLFLSQMGMY